MNGNKEQLNFWDQMNYPFLLDKSSTELFKFIVDSGEDDQISKVLKTMVSDRQSISKEIDMIQGSINLLDSDIENYQNQIEAGKEKLEICNKIIELQSSVARLNQLKILHQEISNTKLEKEEVNKNYESIKKKKDVWIEFYQIYKNSLERLNLLQDNFIRLHSIVEDLSDTTEKLNKLEKERNIKLEKLQNLLELKEFKKTINYIRSQEKSLEIKPRIICNYSKEYYEKLMLLRKIKYELKDITTNKNEKNSVLNDINLKITNYKTMKEMFDVCPICGNKIHQN